MADRATLARSRLTPPPNPDDAALLNTPLTADLIARIDREDAEQLCAARDWIATPYEDNDQSAKVADKRPAFR